MFKLIAPLVMSLVLAAWAHADDGQTPVPPATSASEPKAPTTRPSAVADNQSDELVFRADRSSAAARLGGGARGEGDGPEVYLLVSARSGRTISARPTLYWYLTEQTDADVDLIVSEPAASQPFYRKRYSEHFDKGLHEFSLAEASEELKPGVQYQVTVTVIENTADPSVNPFSSGLIERVASPANLSASQTTPAEYCANGLWYDALEGLTRAIDRDPANAHLRRQRLALLRQEQVFLAFAPDKKWADLPGIPKAQARAKEHEAQLLDSLSAEDARQIRGRER